MDAIHEYLLRQGVEVVAIHGSKDQEERNWAMDEFKAGRKDVLIATDVASKGLDFPRIEHVINFDMPKEIENYVHRIGRTGRAGHKGVATTLVGSHCGMSILLDLKHILREAKQHIPPFLEALRVSGGGLLLGMSGCVGQHVCRRSTRDMVAPMLTGVVLGSRRTPTKRTSSWRQQRPVLHRATAGSCVQCCCHGGGCPPVHVPGGRAEPGIGR